MRFYSTPAIGEGVGLPSLMRALLVVCLIVIPVIAVSHPLPTAHAQNLSQAETKFQQYLYPGYFNYTQITVDSPAIIGYATDSNVSIDTAFMTPEQEGAFAQSGDITNSVFYQTGQQNYNALLEVPGTYDLVMYAPDGAASISGLYIINSNINLQNSTTSVAETVTIQPGSAFTIPLHVETLGSTSRVEVLGASSQAVQYVLQDKTTNQVVFASPQVTISNFTVVPTVSLGYNFTLDPGQYFMDIQNSTPNPAIVYFQYTITPEYVNPYLLLFGPPSPTGITAYGLYNQSGSITTYKVASSSIVGFADIRQLKAVDNGTNSPEASLQENAVLQVNNTDGSTFTYWPQNVLDFDTSAHTVTYRDNMLNTTGDGAQLTNQSIIGTGTTNVANNNGVVQTYYGNYNSNYTYSYSLPQAWILYMNETVVSGQGVLIQMGQRALDGAAPDRITWFDNIMVQDPNVQSADFIVNGKQYTPAGANSFIGSFYDAELVFGGGPGGQAAHFTLNANLALFYWDQTLKPFPSVYTFGDDTAEAAFNILVTNGNGAASVTSGAPYYGILTNDFNASLPHLISQALAARQSGLPYTGLLIGAAVVAVIVVLVLVLVVRRRSAKMAEAMQQVPAVAQPALAYCGNCGTPVDPAAMFCPNCGAPQHEGGAGPAQNAPG